MNDRETITGILKNMRNVAFSICNYQVVLFRTDGLKESVRIDTDVFGYIWGVTTDRNEIAIYVGTSIKIYDSRIINTWNYIISKNIIGGTGFNKISGIRFENGSVKSIFSCNALAEDRELEEKLRKQEKGHYLVYKYENDIKTFLVNDMNKTITWRFHSVVKLKDSIVDGLSLSNSYACLDILFPEESSYGEYYRYYGYVSSFISFLSFRKTIIFDKVSLLYEDSQYGLIEIAECFNRQPEEIDIRNFSNAISIYYLSNPEAERILQNIMHPEMKEMYIPLSVLPKNEKDLYAIDANKIQTVCTALEAEINLDNNIRNAKDKALVELIDSIKGLIKKHREGDNPLPPKTYSLIHTSISHWGDSLSDKIKTAWSIHAHEIEPLFQFYNININKMNIDSFVKKRNKITHEGFSEVADEEIITTFLMIGLLYCMTLTRMGIEPDKIRDLMSKRIIG